jgi:hypothetical protein
LVKKHDPREEAIVYVQVVAAEELEVAEVGGIVALLVTLAKAFARRSS